MHDRTSSLLKSSRVLVSDLSLWPEIVCPILKSYKPRGLRRGVYVGLAEGDK